MAASLGSTPQVFNAPHVAQASPALQHTHAPVVIPTSRAYATAQVGGGGSAGAVQGAPSHNAHVPWRNAPGHTTAVAARVASATASPGGRPSAPSAAHTMLVMRGPGHTVGHTRTVVSVGVPGGARATTGGSGKQAAGPKPGLSRRTVVATRAPTSPAPVGGAQSADSDATAPPASSGGRDTSRASDTASAASAGTLPGTPGASVIHDDDGEATSTRPSLTGESIRDVVQRARGPKRRRLTPVITGPCIGCRNVKSLKYSVPARLLRGVRVPPHQCCRQCWLFLRRHFWLDRNQPHVHCRNKARFHCRERLHKFALPTAAYFRCHFVSTNPDGMVVGIGATSDEEVTIAPPPGSRPAPLRVMDDDTYGLGSGDKVRPHQVPHVSVVSRHADGARNGAQQTASAASPGAPDGTAAGRDARQIANPHPLEDPHQAYSKPPMPGTWASRGRTIATADRRRKRGRSPHEGSPRRGEDTPANIEAAASNLCAAGAKARTMSGAGAGARAPARSKGKRRPAPGGAHAGTSTSPGQSNQEETAAAALAWLASMPGCAGASPPAATRKAARARGGGAGTGEARAGKASPWPAHAQPGRRQRNSSQEDGDEYDEDDAMGGDDGVNDDAGLVMQTPWSNGAKPRETVRLFDTTRPLDSITYVSLRARLQKMVHEHPGRKLGRYYGALKWCCKNCRTIFKDRAKPFRLPPSDVRHVLRLLRLQACYDVGMRGSDSTGNTTNHGVEAPPTHDGVECAAGKRMWELLADVKPQTRHGGDAERGTRLRAAGVLALAHEDDHGELAHA